MEWIDVEDRCPKKGSYLVIVSGDKCEANLIEAEFVPSSGWKIPHILGWFNVLYWTEMPETPEYPYE